MSAAAVAERGERAVSPTTTRVLIASNLLSLVLLVVLALRDTTPAASSDAALRIRQPSVSHQAPHDVAAEYSPQPCMCVCAPCSPPPPCASASSYPTPSMLPSPSSVPSPSAAAAVVVPGGIGPAQPVGSLAHAYVAHVERVLANVPPADRKYMVLTANGGWGNKLRAIEGFLEVMLLTDDRILLLPHDRLGWIREFFQPLVPVMYTDQVTDLPAAKDQLNFDMMCLGRGKPFDADCLGHPTPKASSMEIYFSMKKTLEDSIDNVQRVAQLGVPLDFYHALRHTVLFMTSQPTQRLLRQVESLKEQLSWSTFRLRLGVHLRTCADCRGDAPYIRRNTGEEQFVINCIRSALQDWQRQLLRNVPGAELARVTMLYLATDAVGDGWREKFTEAFADLAVVKWHAGVTSFLNSDNTNNPDVLDAIMTDWYTLGETDVTIGTSTTFHQTAALRRNLPSRAFRHRDGQWRCELLIDPRGSERSSMPDLYY